MSANPIDDHHAHRLENVRFDPVFILGAHRSGTTVLYQMLQATGSFNVVTVYHIVNYDEILDNHLSGRAEAAKSALGALLRGQGVSDRAIDGVHIGPDLPEEYGFILRNAGLKPCVDDQSLPGFVELCRKIQFVSDPARPLLLKNPRDSSRFMFLHETFPTARFLFIHRDPIDTINSHLRAIRDVFGTRNEYLATINRSYRRMYANPVRLLFSRLKVSARLGLDLKRARRAYQEKADYYLANIGSLPRSAYRAVTYEDLCSRPDKVLREILDFLHLPADSAGRAAAMIDARATVLLDEVKEHRADIRHGLQTYCRLLGYEAD
jgi:hypothetical protein